MPARRTHVPISPPILCCGDTSRTGNLYAPLPAKKRLSTPHRDGLLSADAGGRHPQATLSGFAENTHKHPDMATISIFGGIRKSLGVCKRDPGICVKKRKALNKTQHFNGIFAHVHFLE